MDHLPSASSSNPGRSPTPLHSSSHCSPLSRWALAMKAYAASPDHMKHARQPDWRTCPVSFLQSPEDEAGGGHNIGILLRTFGAEKMPDPQNRAHCLRQGTVVRRRSSQQRSSRLSCTPCRSSTRSSLCEYYLSETLVHVVLTFSRLLFMTYNGWIMLAVAVGAFVGYLMFSPGPATKTVACH